LWRGADGRIQVQDDYCPHRGAPLSRAMRMGDRLVCAYHGVEIAGDGTVIAVPGEPDCPLVGQKAVRTYPAREMKGAIFAWMGDDLHPEPVPFTPPEQLYADAYDAFLCYGEWRVPYRYPLDNNMDPMHGAFLHAQSHSMAEGRKVAQFAIRPTASGFFFEKKDQRDVNFDWSEWYDASIQCVRLEIPYPKTGSPGGNFGIVFHVTPIDEDHSACFVFRFRRVTGWQRDLWRFLYKNRLESRHFHVLEQDRAIMEAFCADADRREFLYRHDLGLARVRRLLRKEAQEQIVALKRAGVLTARARRRPSVQSRS
ncbi:MAG: Rieske 2Fe-2S domain-containing protein, partial [Alphaproteobacteria bacterium]|nr:Rieske 2Fe-2S domain-containing protein [Alphaproteobacteria bacterium]